MKKKFLALALAAAVMAPTTSAFASQTVGGADTNTYNADVQVEGVVQKADGSAPAGRIEVELPLKTAFTVDKDGKFTGSNFTVDNKGGEAVKLTLASFVESNPTGGITIDNTMINTGAADATNAKHFSNFSRSNVRLQLNSTIGTTSNTVDLERTLSSRDLGDIPAGTSAAIAITGLAGTKADAAGVDATGVSEEFTLRFSIRKA